MGYESWNYNASLAGIVYLHLSLWGALITTSLSIYTFSLGASDPILVPCGVLLILAVRMLLQDRISNSNNIIVLGCSLLHSIPPADFAEMESASTIQRARLVCEATSLYGYALVNGCCYAVVDK